MATDAICHTALDLTNPNTFIEHDPRVLWRSIRPDRAIYWHDWHREGEGFWVLTRHADILEIYRDAERFISGRGTVLDVLLRGDDSAGGQMLAVTDHERHREIRTVMMRAFSRRMLDSVADRVRRRTRTLVRQAVDIGELDFATDVAEHIPLHTICDLLLIPEEDRAQLLAWNKLTLSSDDPSVDHFESLAARSELLWYLSDLAADRRAAPGEDVVSMLATAEVGEHLMTLDEIALNCYSLILGGDESSRMSATTAVRALAHHPEQFAALRDGSIQDSATEEMLRWATPAMHFARRAAVPVELHGQTIKAGDIVTLWNTSANDDENEFDDPDRLDITRRPNRHLALGFGPHFCIGAFLGRAELNAMLSAVAEHVREIEIIGPEKRVHSNFLFGYSRLPVRFVA